MTEHWIWLAQRPGIGPRRAAKLLEHFGSAEELYNAAPETYLCVEGIGEKELPALSDKDLAGAAKILSFCENAEITVLTRNSPEYPGCLRAVEDPPVVLYCLGELPDFDERPAIGIVGARKSSVYGNTAARRLGYQLERGGAIVVSGFAKGIDASAMEGALLAGNRVVGVLGCGVDVLYPKANRALYEEIRFRGCLLSEYAPGTPPYASNFPIRNRIISGLCDGVLVVEAAKVSGSLITARHALEQGRDVFAVPGTIDSEGSSGSNHLLKEGAGLVETGADILREYLSRYPGVLRPEEAELPAPAPLPKQEPLPAPKPAPVPKPAPAAPPARTLDDLCKNAGPEEQKILRAIENKKLFVDDIVDLTQLPASRVLAAVTMLEIRGLLCRHAGNRFSVNFGG